MQKIPKNKLTADEQGVKSSTRLLEGFVLLSLSVLL